MSHFPVAAALPVVWQKSSRSNPNDNCVECAPLSGDIAVRDSKDPAGPALRFSRAAWGAFAAAAGADRLSAVHN
ncbi:hypothetical protein P3T36_003816 [Kitasatospora sp. MAP12-15]|uniref:DUF397 domain-containing protein n=1 Tax=unclassified Kitasatospora TaxID=2633591 RepID=UPI002474F62C|nr:DUF397 domain-containing protein [Kitasatospora sp. MAP12-44]MDH6112405.1 hypothetical protein [Kitasatospora sp. MAP12-44]